MQVGSLRDLEIYQTHFTEGQRDSMDDYTDVGQERKRNVLGRLNEEWKEHVEDENTTGYVGVVAPEEDDG